MTLNINRLKHQRCRYALITATALSIAAAPAAACFNPAKHFRGGQWRQWILQIAPGAEAQARVEQIIKEVNAARAAGNVPPLVYSTDEPIVIGMTDENNPRGPNGEPLKSALPNQEIFFGTFAALAPKQPVVIFLTDPLRSNADLTAAGVPGRAAEFAIAMNVQREGANSAITTKWVAQNGLGDRVQFYTKYTASDIAARFRAPASAEYLGCNMFQSLSIVFRSLPVQTFAFFERIQMSVIQDFGRPTVDVELNVQLSDPIVHAIFNDPANKYLRLIETDRTVRIQRQP